jgi:hypothetical protein
MCVDVCHPNDSITCGVYGRSVSVYFVITPTLQMNLSDTYWVAIQGDKGLSFGFPFGNPVSQAQPGNVVSIHPERMCGFVVNSASVNDSGQYLCTIKHFAIGYTWSVTLNQQTLQLCGR